MLVETLYSDGIVLFKCIKCALKHTAQKQKFHLISWCINFLERHSFRRVSGYLPEILRKLCLSIIFSNQEIRWNFGISLSDSDRKEVTGDRNSFIFAPNIPRNLATWITMMMFFFYMPSVGIMYIFLKIIVVYESIRFTKSLYRLF